MWKLLALALGALIAYRAYASVMALRRNIALAKESGIPYRIVPFWFLHPFWLVFGNDILHLVDKVLPLHWRGLWFRHLAPNQTWRDKYTVFAELDSDLFMLVSPSRILLEIADADAIAQIAQRRNDFPKPIEIYVALDIYGKNVVSTEGQYWRHHRKIVAPPFNEQNNRLVWDESLHQVQNLMAGWTGPDGNASRTITTVVDDTMRLALYVISKAGFGRSMEWPGGDTAARDGARLVAEKPDAARQMTYTACLNTVLHNVMLLVALPAPLLRWSPVAYMRQASAAKAEWSEYMRDIYHQKLRELAGDQAAGDDLMAGLIAAAGNPAKGGAPLLSLDEVMGNAFVILIAGHETTANTLHFALVLLAMHPAAQRAVQADLDAVLGERPLREWSYDTDFPRLGGGLLGAVLAETLRVIPPIVDIPKCTRTPQTLTVGATTYHIPAGTQIGLNTVAVHRNPRFWPHGPPRDPAHPEHPRSNLTNDLEEFKPERWLLAGAAGRAPATGPAPGRADEPGPRPADADDLHVDTSADTAPTLYKPMPGSYLPFSEGFRSCVGRRFAQVEFLAVMAAVLRDWSVELAVDAWATDDEVAAMDARATAAGGGPMGAEKRACWDQARRRARHTLDEDAATTITLQLRAGACVPVRFVRRGKERFAF